MAQDPVSITGTIRIIGETQTFPSGFIKREVIIDTEEQYPQPLSVEFLKDKTSLVDNYNEGDKVRAHLNLRGKPHTPAGGETRFYNSIVCWKIEKL